MDRKEWELTDEELFAAYETAPGSHLRGVATAAARKALESAAKQADNCDGYNPARVAHTIRKELNDG